MSTELGYWPIYVPGVVPLAEAIVWPSDMSDREAEFFVRRLERAGALRIGASLEALS